MEQPATVCIEVGARWSGRAWLLSMSGDEIVFAEKGDLLLFGARSLEGMSLTVDPRRKKLVAAGPLLAAVAQT